MTITIRPIREEDAAPLLALLRKLDEETHFMMFEPGERTITEEEQRERIRGQLASGRGMSFIAETESGEPVGVLGAMAGSFQRNRHSVHIFIGILQAHSGQGLGRRLFETMETWARGWGARRLELTVMCHNTRAVALYQKMGFTIEGTRRDSLWVDGQYIDEYAMSKILE